MRSLATDRRLDMKLEASRLAAALHARRLRREEDDIRVLAEEGFDMAQWQLGPAALKRLVEALAAHWMALAAVRDRQKQLRSAPAVESGNLVSAGAG